MGSPMPLSHLTLSDLEKVKLKITKISKPYISQSLVRPYVTIKY